VRSLLDRGLAKGGSPENAVVVEEKSVSAAGGLRFPDEFVRHKILDLLGDLYLLGRPLRARVIALRAGHDLHCRLAERFLFLSAARHSRKKETNHV
jgi:UDP-3-O-[3-hydroxymyristoyl] N-acetylglucosamine deacetylase